MDRLAVISRHVAPASEDEAAASGDSSLSMSSCYSLSTNLPSGPSFATASVESTFKQVRETCATAGRRPRWQSWQLGLRVCQSLSSSDRQEQCFGEHPRFEARKGMGRRHPSPTVQASFLL